MNKLIRNCFVVFLVLMTGMVWLDAQAAKPVKVTVESAFPDNADQGDLIDVEIEGTGFDDGSTARFIVTDTRDDTQIDVQSVEYLGPGKLKAKIKVKDAALVIDYDIEVTTSSGRRGKGTTLFRVQERTGVDDPCLTSVSPFPAFMLLRPVNSANGSNQGVYLSSEDGVCVRLLVEIPESSEALFWESELGYDQESNLGYVVWGRGTMTYGGELWLQEFTVSGNSIDPPSPPELILTFPDYAPMDGLEIYLPGFDISPDLQSLAYTYEEQWLDDLDIAEVHVVSIDSCRHPYEPCEPTSESLILNRTNPYHSRGQNAWTHIAWDPLGVRLYLVEQNGNYYEPEPWAIRMVTVVDGDWVDTVLLSEADYPEYATFVRLSSGVVGVGNREKLAFRHEGDCWTISVIDVAYCEAGPTETDPLPCTAESQFYGTNPGWTEQGTIVHEIIDRVKTHPRKEIYECTSSDFIGEWNPSGSEVTPLVEGENPDTP